MRVLRVLITVLGFFLFLAMGCCKRSDSSLRSEQLAVVIKGDLVSVGLLTGILNSHPRVVHPKKNIEYTMKVVKPDTTGGYVILQVEPDPNAGYTILIVDPETGQEVAELNPEIADKLAGLLRRKAK